MHIPDGFLSGRVAAGYGLLALVAVGAACSRVRTARERPSSALLGVSAAFIFAAQMVNFPVAAGTSGHLVGGALAAALLGLPSAVVVMSSVLFVQCFVFGDGGVFSLGANVFNMALVSSLVGFCCYRLLCGPTPSPTRRVAAVAFASWCATVIAAASCAEQLALSDTARLSVVLPAMLGVHALVGIGEAVITAIVLAAVLRFRPELLEIPGNAGVSARRGRSLIGYGLGLSVAIVAVLAPIACDSPDGLSSVAQSLGFQSAERVGLVAAPLAEYTVPGLGSGLLATILAGSAGALLLFGLCWLLALGLVPRSRQTDSAQVAVESP
ncbi:MAG TPA: energy-coupling factor ABC transporter permease [Polyangiaceae bacterium]|nr:energy-coupling factor ABC transporter permease [Polyangiaceae bacterium]